MKRRMQHPDRKGFSLIEVMISMSLLSVGILGVVASHVAASKSDGHGYRMTQATAIAQAVAHQFSVLPYDDARIQDRSGTCTDVDDITPFLSATAGCKSDISMNAGTTSSSVPIKVSTNAMASFGALDSSATKTFDAIAENNSLDFNDDGVPDFEIYVNIRDRCVDTTNPSAWSFGCTGAKSIKQIGVIVRWPRNDGTFNAISTVVSRFNPANLGT